MIESLTSFSSPGCSDEPTRRALAPDDRGRFPRIAAIATEVHPAFPRTKQFRGTAQARSRGLRCLERTGSVDADVVSHPWWALAPPKLNTLVGALPSPATTYYARSRASAHSSRGGPCHRSGRPLRQKHSAPGCCDVADRGQRLRPSEPQGFAVGRIRPWPTSSPPTISRRRTWCGGALRCRSRVSQRYIVVLLPRVLELLAAQEF